jgi:lysophospholipase L1-like esterase
MHKPWHTLIFAVLIFTLLGSIALVFPKQGIRLAAANLVYPDLVTLFKTREKKDIKQILHAVKKEEGTMVLQDTMQKTAGAEEKVKSRELITTIQYRNISALEKFFNALDRLEDEPAAIRVLHYGDSQIEGDRITDHLRTKLQSMFGGSGPGLLSLMPVTRSAINLVENSDGWERYNVFVAPDQRVKHKNYGVLGGFARFAEYGNFPANHKAELTVHTTTLGGASVMNYRKVKLFYGGARRKTWCEFYDGPALIAADSLNAYGNFHVKEYNTGNGTFKHRFVFRGNDSPDFYAISLETGNGVLVDNIGMRGSSGTFFHQVDPGQLQAFYSYLNAKLIILQFGGNAVPAIKDSVMAANYGDYIRYQLKILKKLAPGASILFVGPADMSMKIGTEYETYPLLEPLRDAVRNAALQNNCAFYDIYDCMGGKNSMPVWVEEKLAGADHTHFSPKGARKISQMFTDALLTEYKNYSKKLNEP